MTRAVNILNVPIDNLTKDELLSRLGTQGGIVFTPNVDHLMKLQKDPEFYKIYNYSTYRVCDSKILMYASKFLGQPLKEKISGSDLFPAFYNYYKDTEEIKIFLMGAAEGVARRAQERINEKVGREIIVDSYSPPFGFEKDEVECQRILDKINNSGATVLAIGVGAPKQEMWIAKYHHRLRNIHIFLAIGATIDFEAGEKARSPQWMSEMGIEWLHRLTSEPGRLWKRYLVEDMPFFWLLMQQKLNLYQAPFTPVQELAPVWQMPPLGQILKEAGLISDYQVRLVLEAQSQQQANQRFGEILADWGWLHQETVDFFADYLPKLPTTPKRHPLGHYLKTAKLLNEEQVKLILAEQQRQASLRFGELAVRKGWVKQQTLDTVLRYITAEFQDLVAA